MLFSSLPLIGIATIISFSKNVLPHWTGPAYSGLILLTACYFAQRKENTAAHKKLLPFPILFANWLLVFIITAGIITIHFFPGTLGKKEQQYLGEGDFTLDMYGWHDLETNFKKIVAADNKNGVMKPNTVIICNKWFPAAHIDFYVAIPLQKELVAIGDTNDIHQYAWINQQRKKLLPGDDAYVIVPSNYYTDVKHTYAPYFTSITGPELIEQKRNGVVCRIFYTWRLKNYKAK